MPIRATMMLADAAQAVGGKLYILGGGWTSVSGAVPQAIALIIHVSWDLTNTRHEWRLELLTEDGAPVKPTSPAGAPPIVIGGNFEAGRPPGLRPGTEMAIPVAISVPALTLEPGRYVWRLLIDGEPDESSRLPFTVHAGTAEKSAPPPPVPPAA